MKNSLSIDEKVLELAKEVESDISKELEACDLLCLYNTEKVLNAFINNNVSAIDFNGTDGYGYNDVGREKIEKIYSEILGAEDSLVRTQFISGSHALTVCLFACLRPGDVMLSITGLPYDTLHEVIGIIPNDSSLQSFGIKYDKISLKDGKFDKDEIKKYLDNHKVKMIMIQRSIGYSTRKSFTIDEVEDMISFIKKIDKDIIVMVDNCYCEFVSEKEPIEVGADLCVGSLIKNLGGSLATNGAYVVGKKDLIKLVAERLNVVGQGKEVGPSLGANKMILQGLANAPRIVLDSIKSAILFSRALKDYNINTNPAYDGKRADIVFSITFNDKELLKNYVNIIQSNSLIDSNYRIEETDMPGYEDKIVMASGSFTSGSSIEMSCDGPIRPPYIAYQQGSFSYYYNKIALKDVIKYLKGEEK